MDHQANIGSFKLTRMVDKIEDFKTANAANKRRCRSKYWFKCISALGQRQNITYFKLMSAFTSIADDGITVVEKYIFFHIKLSKLIAKANKVCPFTVIFSYSLKIV